MLSMVGLSEIVRKFQTWCSGDKELQVAERHICIKHGYMWLKQEHDGLVKEMGLAISDNCSKGH